MKNCSSKELIRILQIEGWYEVCCTGEHRQFRHPTRPGLVTVPHPREALPARSLQAIQQQAGVRPD